MQTENYRNFNLRDFFDIPEENQQMWKMEWGVLQLACDLSFSSDDNLDIACDTIGIEKSQKLPRHQAVLLKKCSFVHHFG